jgi:3-carboxy-cis,cis-muconate cycloisomerase
MRPYSSPSEPATPAAPAGLFDGVLARGAVREVMGDRAWLGALLSVEAALARSLADVGAVPAGAAVAIAAAADRMDLNTDLIADLSAAAAASGNPVVALVERLRSAVPPEAAGYVHMGATSQDIMDTAAMLLADRARDALRGDLRAAADAAAALAREHRDTPMAARTLLQQAVPTTFGLKAAGWCVGLDEVSARLATVRLPAQLGGAAGTLAGLDPEAGARLAAQLGLASRVLPWHTTRTPIADLAGALGGVAGVVGKVARDVVLLAQSEVAEVAEGKPGGSSAMAHKRNPVAAVSALAGSIQAPGLVASLLASMPQEHERAAGAWHAEWRPLRELLIATGSAASWLRECLAHLQVDGAAMRANLDRLLRTLGASEPDVGFAPALVDRVLTDRGGAA